jgi:hypothetical protein
VQHYLQDQDKGFGKLQDQGDDQLLLLQGDNDNTCYIHSFVAMPVGSTSTGNSTNVKYAARQNQEERDLSEHSHCMSAIDHDTTPTAILM